MAETLWLTRKANALYAADGLAGNDLAKLPAGVKLKAEIKKPRSLPRDRLYRAIATLVAENTDAFPNQETLHQATKQALGYTRIYLRKGATITQAEAEQLARQIIVVQASIAHNKMSDAEFAEYFDRTMDFYTSEVIPGIGRDELTEQAREMLGTG